MSQGISQTRLIQDWIDRLRAGDESARNKLFDVAYQRLLQLTRKMLHNYPRVRRWEETDDVMQNAAMRLHRTLAEVHPATAADFFRLAALNVRRELLDMAKHYYGPQGQGANYQTDGHASDTGVHASPVQNEPDAGDTPDRLAAWTEFHHQVEQLPEEERDVFGLLWYQGLSQAEAAEVLGVSERTIKRRWQSARLRLHEALGGQMPDA
jgi:RNA polymerase sigma factor (sigma-70 family)